MTEQEILEKASSNGDRVEYFMTNPPKPIGVHLQYNVRVGDFTKGLTMEQYASLISREKALDDLVRESEKPGLYHQALGLPATKGSIL